MKKSLLIVTLALLGIATLSHAQTRLDGPPDFKGKKAIEIDCTQGQITVRGEEGSTVNAGDMLMFGQKNHQNTKANSSVFLDLEIPANKSYLVYIQMSQGNPNKTPSGEYYFDVVTKDNEKLIGDGLVDDLSIDRKFKSYGTDGLSKDSWYELAPIELKKGKHDFVLACVSPSSGQVWFTKIILVPEN